MSQKYTVGDGSPFLKRIVIPFYIIRIAVMLLQIVLYGITIGYASSNRSELNDIGGTTKTASWVIAILVVVMMIIIGCLLLDLICIIKRSRRTLTPRFFLICNCIQTAVWTILFALTVAGSEGRAITVIINIIIYASFIGLLIYASVIYHKHRKGTLGGAYAPANQNQPTAYNGYANEQQPKPYSSQPYEMDNRYA
ncbi:hypothetical protein CGCF415_v002799 [Colletotrichum fructicola]|uniref:Cys met metabolism pyridoxal phosphate-dependent enzyme n=1 Tax=Colletotrichum fructicola (strain Nara gc5) TaxID=1213859 RepID=L2GAN3_COLFN|nr:uncharacterized protein CGMCC3_g10444 [Colletotrichum fructicola]KAF4484868.1 hypothetical protein CGGC5_v006940 [Colletotrichum fructicola Nara gc5]KAI8290495.1 hypothetical protein K4K60_005321 [Colletotrichum sp. SAR11_57]KAE9573527.1 hypothetical protein CGMCC3_g10444 [Colletotrichum fructicola]KAF4421418.1 hypothetical protein CFRS1_v011393 [Colletotrichum fructicola]KAF4903008.1 hypothetical protein CGCFRS4_v001939 [Colletotrichum fructicola]